MKEITTNTTRSILTGSQHNRSSTFPFNTSLMIPLVNVSY